MEEIYRAHFDFVWAVLRRLGVADRDLEDVAHDVFVVVQRRLDDFEGRAALRTWLYAIALRVAANHLRRRRTREPVAATSGSTFVAPRAASDPEEHAVRSEASALLHALLGRLDADKRAVFVLSDIEGLTAPEIAEITGANPRTVYSRLRAARQRVHADLAKLRSREGSARDPRRWMRGAAREDAPPPEARGRVWAALLVGAPELGGPLVATPTAGAGATVLKSIGLSVGLGLAGLGVLWIAAAPSRDARAQETAGARETTTSADAPPHASDRAADRPRSPAAQVITAAVPAAAPALPLPADAASTVRDARRQATARAPSPATAPPPDDALVAELPWIEAARDALAHHDPAAALRALATHAQRFPDGVLAPDRERSRVQALCALGRDAQARRAAEAAGISGACAG